MNSCEMIAGRRFFNELAVSVPLQPAHLNVPYVGVIEGGQHPGFSSKRANRSGSEAKASGRSFNATERCKLVS
jgi:hypothetical protein